MLIYTAWETIRLESAERNCSICGLSNKSDICVSDNVDLLEDQAILIFLTCKATCDTVTIKIQATGSPKIIHVFCLLYKLRSVKQVGHQVPTRTPPV